MQLSVYKPSRQKIPFSGNEGWKKQKKKNLLFLSCKPMQDAGLGSVMSALCSRGRPNAIALSIDMCSLKGVWGFFV